MSVMEAEVFRGQMAPSGLGNNTRVGSISTQDPSQGLSGLLYHDGKPTSVGVSPRGSVTITNERGQASSGQMSGNDIVISSGIRGRVSPNGQRIYWSNGTECAKESEKCEKIQLNHKRS